MLPEAPDPVPVLETPRLRLRRQRATDFDATYAIWSHPEVVRHITGKPFTREECWARLLRHVGHWVLRPYGPWAVERRDTGEYIGEVALFDLQRDMEPSQGDLPEAGWVLAPGAHGQGYATEAMQAVLEWGDRHLDGRGCFCIINPANAASLAVARKLGFVDAGPARYKNEEIRLLHRPRGG
jgi:RimJ/RimL family protein N-acetyltransferase